MKHDKRANCHYLSVFSYILEFSTLKIYIHPLPLDYYYWSRTVSYFVRLLWQHLLRENLTRVRHILAEPPFGVLKPARRGRTLLESESRAVTAAVSLAYSSQVRRTSLHTYMLGYPHTLPTTCVPYTYYYTYYTYTLY